MVLNIRENKVLWDLETFENSVLPSISNVRNASEINCQHIIFWLRDVIIAKLNCLKSKPVKL